MQFENKSKTTIDVDPSKLAKTFDFAPIKKGADLMKTLKIVALDLCNLLSHEVGKKQGPAKNLE